LRSWSRARPGRSGSKTVSPMSEKEFSGKLPSEGAGRQTCSAIQPGCATAAHQHPPVLQCLTLSCLTASHTGLRWRLARPAPSMLPPSLLPPSMLPPSLLPPSMLPPSMLPPSRSISPRLAQDAALRLWFRVSGSGLTVSGNLSPEMLNSLITCK